MCNIKVDDINVVSSHASFWRQVLYAWCLYNFTMPDTVEQIMGQVIWFNSHIRIADVPFCNYNAWHQNLVYVSDLFSPDGVPRTHNEIISKHGNCITWLEHMQIIAAIPHEWKEKMLQANDAIQPEFSITFAQLTQNHKISNIVYNKFIFYPEVTQKASLKWSTRLNCNIDCNKLNKMFKNIVTTTIATKYRDFQYRLMHNLIVNNRQLFLWKLLDNDKCTFCKIEMEHTMHLFLQCMHVKKIWEHLENFISVQNPELTPVLDWSSENIIFNLVHPKSGHVVNFLVLITKQYIYRCRCLLITLEFSNLKKEIEAVRRIEYYIAKDKAKLQNHYSKWSQLYPELILSYEENTVQQQYIDMYLELI